jgi:hypothetical protein
MQRPSVRLDQDASAVAGEHRACAVLCYHAVFSCV